jgi:putative PIG3 family NAD(P)H quinone oxidoreductase
MRAVIIREPGDESVLTLVERPAPEVPPGHVRVRVTHTAVNRADLLQRAGFYPAPPGVPADIPGLEYAGVVESHSPGSVLSKGQRVFGLVAGGSYAEFVVVHEREAVRIPDDLPDHLAAAVPEAFVTAYDALVLRAGLKPGERVLVHAVGSGVGTAGLQIAKALGCHVTGTSRTAAKLERAAELGLDRGVLVRDAVELAEVLGPDAAFDVVLDLVGGPYVGATLPSLNSRGRVVVVGLTGGVRSELDLATLLRRRLTLVGTVLRSRPLEEKIQAADVLRRTLVPWLARGMIRPIVERSFTLEEAGLAHRALATNETFGKVVLRV